MGSEDEFGPGKVDERAAAARAAMLDGGRAGERGECDQGGTASASVLNAVFGGRPDVAL